MRGKEGGGGKEGEGEGGEGVPHLSFFTKNFSKNFSSDMHMRYEGTYFSFAAVDNDETICSVGQSCRSGCGSEKKTEKGDRYRGRENERQKGKKAKRQNGTRIASEEEGEGRKMDIQ